MVNTFERFDESFEDVTNGFLDGGDYGVVTVVPSGTNGITAPDGGSFAIVEQTDGGPFTRFDGYRALDSGQGFTAQIKIYLDPGAMAAGEGFDYSVAANNQSGAHLRDFIFHVTQDTSTGQLLIGASNNTNFDPVENLESGNHGVITTAGWYTFEHTFYDAGNDTLAVSMTVKNAAGVPLFTQVLNNPSDIYSTDFGGNRYGWFTNVDVAGGVAVDEARLLTEDTNPVIVKEGSVIVATYASIQDAKDALDNGDITPGTAEISTTGLSDNFFYVAEGMSIQAAIDASSDGDSIEVAAGTFSESININKEVSLTGAGAGQTILSGTLLADLSVPGGTPLNDYFEQNNPAYSASVGVQISADDVTFSGFTITSFSEAMAINTSDGASITDNQFIDNVTGLRKGTAQDVTNVTISNNSFSQGIHGITIYAAPDGSGAFDGVTMDSNTFSALSEKGMYFEQLSNAELNDNVFDDVGNFGRISPPFGGTQGEFGQAIDINLKYENYENVVFNDTIITNSGHSDQDGNASPGAFGAAIGVKIRDDGPSYNAQPATFTGNIEFNGGSIDGTSTGFRIGEPGKDNLGPNVHINGVEISNTTVTDVENATDATSGGLTEVTMALSQGSLDASSSQSSVHVNGTASGDNIVTGTGDDTIVGGAGNDTIDGGDGIDTVVYNGSFDDFSAVLGSLTLTDENTSDGNEGTDSLTNIEVVAFSDVTVLMVGGDSSYTTIQAAIDAASAGDTIVVRAGTYNESLTISKEITIIGEDVGGDGVPDVYIDPATAYGITITGDIDNGGTARVVIDGVAVDGASSAGVHISSSATLSSLEITNSAFSNNGAHGVASGSGAPGLGSISISNSTFENNGHGGANGAGDIVLFGFRGDATIENVTITSAATNATPVASRGDNAIQISGYDPATYDVLGPIGDVTLINVSVDGWYHKPQVLIQGYNNLSGLTLTDVHLTGGTSWGDLLFIDPIASSGLDTPGNPGYPGNFPLIGGVSTLDLSGVTINSSSTGVLGVDSRIRGTDAADLITGTNGNDLLNDLAETGVDYGGDDTVFGLGGNDILLGGAGADFLAGGDGADTLNGGAGHDRLDGGLGVDTIDYSAYTDAITVNLASNPFSFLSAGDGFAFGAATGADGLTSIEVVIGTNGDDVISGASGSETLSGQGGNDSLFGQGGNDELIGDGGSDLLVGGSGDDYISGGADNDDLRGDSGRDTVSGGAGDDIMRGHDGNDRLYGDDGKDTILGGNGADLIEGRNGNDFLKGDAGNDWLLGGEGNDAIQGGADNDMLRGENGNDVLFGDNGQDTIEGAAGVDELRGGAGNDSLSGGDDNDIIFGWGENDVLLGDAGNDFMKGDAGNDTLDGGAGQDSLIGGAGNDVFRFSADGATDYVGGFSGGAGASDQIQLIGYGAAFDSFAEVMAAATQSGTRVIIDFGGGDQIHLLNTSLASLSADDFLFG